VGDRVELIDDWKNVPSLSPPKPELAEVLEGVKWPVRVRKHGWADTVYLEGLEDAHSVHQSRLRLVKRTKKCDHSPLPWHKGAKQEG
jgi:hypothetical protein